MTIEIKLCLIVNAKQNKACLYKRVFLYRKTHKSFSLADKLKLLVDYSFVLKHKKNWKTKLAGLSVNA